jgi:hypothetical protein
VIELVPRVAPPLADSVSALLDLVELGERLAVTPLGRPDTDRLTVPLNPPVGVMIIVLVALFPCLRPAASESVLQ